MSIEKIKIGVAGAGAMGSGIALVAAQAGHSVVIYDSFVESLKKSEIKINTDINKLVEKGKLTADKSSAIKNNITFSESTDKLANCNLIIEAIIEDLPAKKNLFKTLEEKVNRSCILATNTSSLSVISIGAECKYQERIVGMHFFNPATVLPLVEIIPSLNTSKEILKQAKSIIDSWGKTAVVAKDTPGFIVNRIARPYYGEAIRIYEEGIVHDPDNNGTGFATVDWAMKTFGGFKMGPFELMDFIGIDINYKVTETVFEQMFYDPRYKPSITQKRLFEGKLFGKKSGKGYYDYTEGNSIAAPDKNDALGKIIFERIICMLINEAADALHFNIATAADIELAMTKGVNYPKGLLKWCDEMGASKVLEQLTSLLNLYNEDRYRPSSLLINMVKENKKFF